MQTATLTADEQIALVSRYFDAVDNADLPALLDTLTPDCIFTVETHGVRLVGHDAIAAMFLRLWDDHATVLHHRFCHVPGPGLGRIASRFHVVNTHQDGSKVHKSNCNFFTLRGGRFSAVAVYMSGTNTLTGPPS